MALTRVFTVAVFGLSFLLGQCRSEGTPPAADINGFQFEMILAHLADFESRMEQTFVARMDELERKVIDACGKQVQHIIEQRTHQLEYLINQPAVFREGGWSTIQRRFDGSVDFYRNWTAYKDGFGDVGGEYWFGLENLYQKLRTGRHELLVVLEDFEGVLGYAHYGDFRVASERQKYELRKLGEFKGSVGDSLRLHEHKPFSTHDVNNAGNAGTNCASEHEGGWWFKSNSECVYSHLNGKYSKKPLVAYEMGVHWHDFRGDRYSLKSCRMMIRPAVDPSRTVT